MMRSRTAQLMFQSAYCALGFVAVLASMGFFAYEFWSDFYVHYTDLSNYFCLGFMLAELVQTAKKKEDGFVTVAPTLKYIGVVAITFTFLVFNIMLAPMREMYLNFSVNSVLLHVVLPILYVTDWFLFYERGKLKPNGPFLSVFAPFFYVVFVYVRAWIVKFNPEVPYLYPYFFLDVGELGIFGVIKWMAILLVAFLAMAFLYFGLDRWRKPRTQRK